MRANAHKIKKKEKRNVVMFSSYRVLTTVVFMAVHDGTVENLLWVHSN